LKSFSKKAVAFIIVFAISAPFVGWKLAPLIALTGALYLHFTERRSSVAKSVVTGSERKFTLTECFDSISQILSHKPKLILSVLALSAIAVPFILNRYQTEIITLGLLYITLAIGLNYIVGLCGLLALGYIAFYAIGAYTYAILNTQFGLNFFICLPLGFATGALAGTLVGLPVLRLRGDYLAIVTLGFGEIVRIVLNNWDSLTAGPNGIMGIARPTLFGFKFGTPGGYYFLAAVLAALAIYMQARLIGSRLGRAWESIREDELAAAHTGVPLFKMKLLAMALGGAWAGAAGVLFASRMTHVSPESFTFLESVLVLCMVILGGMGSIAGVSVGAMALILLPELLRGALGYRMLAFGLLMVLAMRFRRSGLIPGRRFKVQSVGSP